MRVPYNNHLFVIVGRLLIKKKAIQNVFVLSQGEKQEDLAFCLVVKITFSGYFSTCFVLIRSLVL